MGTRRKRNGEGSIFPRLDSDGKIIGYRGQQYIGDKRKSYSGKTYDAVKEKMEFDRVDFKRGDYVEPSELTVGDWAEHWLEHEKKPRVREQTYLKIKYMFDEHILPILGDYKLQKLTKKKIEKAYDQMFVERTKPNGEPYSESLVRQTSSYFNSCLKSAVHDEKLIKNPHDGVIVPEGRARKRVDAYTLQEQEKLIDFLKNSNMPIDWLLYLLLCTGMREGEGIALTWDDVDLNEKTISINKTYAYSGSYYQVQFEPKTKKGNRVISVSDNVVKLLRKARKQFDQEKNVRHIVIPNAKYNYFQPDYLRRRLEKVCAILDIRYISVHALRHTWATRCLEKDIPIKVVSEMLGHENVMTTANIYQSVLRQAQEEVADILNELF